MTSAYRIVQLTLLTVIAIVLYSIDRKMPVTAGELRKGTPASRAAARLRLPVVQIDGDVTVTGEVSADITEPLSVEVSNEPLAVTVER